MFANATGSTDQQESTEEMIARALAFTKQFPPLPKFGPGPDLIVARDVYDALKAAVITPSSSPLWTGYGVEVHEWMEPGMILGVTEAGRALVKEMRDEPT